MSRYTLDDSGLFGAIVIGWDPGVSGFFVQCFEENEEDDEPSEWHPRLSLGELQAQLAGYGVSLSEFVYRVLHAEERDQRPAFRAGDPVLLRDPATQKMLAGCVVEFRQAGLGMNARALVEHADGARWLDVGELEPDLESVGVC